MNKVRPLPFNLILFFVAIVVGQTLVISTYVPFFFEILFYFPVFVIYLIYEIVQIRRGKINKLYEPILMGLFIPIVLFNDFYLLSNLREAILFLLEKITNSEDLLIVRFFPAYFLASLGGIGGLLISRLVDCGLSKVRR